MAASALGMGTFPLAEKPGAPYFLSNKIHILFENGSK
jgi:hypothetical protein